MNKRQKVQKLFLSIALFIVQILSVQCESQYEVKSIQQDFNEQIQSSALPQQNYFQKNFRFQQSNNVNCQPGEYLYEVTSSYSICIKCQEGCSQCCDTNFCMKCSSSYFLNTVNSTCQQCSQGCILCQNQKACQQCEVGMYLDQISLQCEKCPEGCKECTSSKECQSCISRYYLPSQKQVCKQCYEGCEDCNNDLAGTCNKCYDYYSLRKNQCKSCPKNCIQCDQYGSCKQCASGYSFIQYQCQRCSVNCLACSSTTNLCEQCLPGYYFDPVSQTCIDCKNPTCETCNPSNSYQCLTCSKDLQLINGKCINCQGVEGSSSFPLGGCTTCGPTDNSCSQCASGYYYDSASKFCSKCPTGCETCNSSQVSLESYYHNHFNYYSIQKVCISCKKGFYFDKNKCTACAPNCLSCDSKSDCKQCINGTYFKGNKCTPCTENCQTCQGSLCLKCIPGYFLNGETCKVCTEDVCTCNLKSIYAQIETHFNSQQLLTPIFFIFIIYLYLSM